ncbi:hypothetical protein [uncultured Roseobacter sp.]|uniref:hypothetical protein n=1 Tax=uncultured Roseobacter sp. TaxID=114847 RepID=UPI0026239226|nr:hypothetical protein [uncultured Roseobacter sp.]
MGLRSRFRLHAKPGLLWPFWWKPVAHIGANTSASFLGDLPDDPKAAPRWLLGKLRKVVDAPEYARIVANRERVAFDGGGSSVAELEDLTRRLDTVVLDGLDDAGGDAFRSWLTAVQDDAVAARKKVLRLPALRSGSASKWMGQ